jgi:hypothetical protein
MKNLNAVAAAGGFAEVINEENIEDVRRMLERIDAERKH